MKSRFVWATMSTIFAIAGVAACNAAPVATSQPGYVTVVFEDGPRGLRVLAATHRTGSAPPDQPLTGARWRTVQAPTAIKPPPAIKTPGASTVGNGKPQPRATAARTYCVTVKAANAVEKRCLQPLAHRHIAPRNGSETAAIVPAKALVGSVRLNAAELPVDVEVVAADGRRATARSRE